MEIREERGLPVMSDLDGGTVFQYHNEYFMVLESEVDCEGDICNAVELTSGELTMIPCGERVRPVKCHLVVEI